MEMFTTEIWDGEMTGNNLQKKDPILYGSSRCQEEDLLWASSMSRAGTHSMTEGNTPTRQEPCGRLWGGLGRSTDEPQKPFRKRMQHKRKEETRRRTEEEKEDINNKHHSGKRKKKENEDCF